MCISKQKTTTLQKLQDSRTENRTFHADFETYAPAVKLSSMCCFSSLFSPLSSLFLCAWACVRGKAA